MTRLRIERRRVSLAVISDDATNPISRSRSRLPKFLIPARFAARGFNTYLRSLSPPPSFRLAVITHGAAGLLEFQQDVVVGERSGRDQRRTINGPATAIVQRLLRHAP